MPSSYTASGRFTLQATGENNNTWGVILNSGAFQLIDTAIMGRLAFTLSGVTKTLTTANGAVDEARNAILDVTSGTGGTVIIPSVSKQYMTRVATSGSVIITTGGITNATLQTGDIMPVWTDGSAVYGLQLSGLSIRDFVAASVLGVPGTLPAQFGNAGKFIKTDGTNATWQFVMTADIPDFQSEVLRRTLVYSLIFGGA